MALTYSPPYFLRRGQFMFTYKLLLAFYMMFSQDTHMFHYISGGGYEGYSVLCVYRFPGLPPPPCVLSAGDRQCCGLASGVSVNYVGQKADQPA
jgi:hypothetical protein